MSMSDENVLVVGTAGGDILALVDRHYLVLDTRPAPVFDLHFAQDTLWDAGAYKKVVDTMTGETLVEGKDNIRALQYWADDLWYVDKKQGIMNTSNVSPIVPKDKHTKVRGLAVLDDQLIQVVDFGDVSRVSNRSRLALGDLPVDDMEVIDNTIYTVGRRVKGEPGGSMSHIRNTATETCKGLEHDILAITEHEGAIVVGGNAIYQINGDRFHYEMMKGGPSTIITALESVPRVWLDQYLKDHPDIASQHIYTP